MKTNTNSAPLAPSRKKEIYGSNMMNRKSHWENIYQTKNLQDVSWYQPVPETSLAFFTDNHVPKDAAIIDIGGGDGFLVDHLLDLGYTDVTVLDISAHALERAKLRLGKRAKAVTWIESDVTAFKPERQYDVWHDRAAFHFLRETEGINYYVSLLKEHVSAGGFVFIGTFSEQGPTKCSGIEIHQYNEQDLSGLIADKYHKIKCIYTDHLTPFNTIQSFIFCSFKHKPAA
jgi:2-polyprenyl-3-methyl-5-hydroxy-6-metoxy-1,4-benzoquinol methylase